MTHWQALGDRSLAVVAEQLGRMIKGRRHAYDTSMARLAEAQAQAKKAREVKLDRTVDFRRRLAAAATEAHQEIESSVLRRSILHGGSSSNSSSSSSSSVDFSSRRENSRKNRGALHATEAAQQLGDDEDNGGGAELSPMESHTARQQQQQQQLQEMAAMKAENGSSFAQRDYRHNYGRVNRNSSMTYSRSGSSGELYRSLARGLDDTHSAILRSMRDDGLDTRPYLDERRKAFH
ncbi:unnamed protein product, partial [Laminaria digitata]